MPCGLCPADDGCMTQDVDSEDPAVSLGKESVERKPQSQLSSTLPLTVLEPAAREKPAIEYIVLKGNQRAFSQLRGQNLHVRWHHGRPRGAWKALSHMQTIKQDRPNSNGHIPAQAPIEMARWRTANPFKCGLGIRGAKILRFGERLQPVMACSLSRRSAFSLLGLVEFNAVGGRHRCDEA